jgi:para-aminobenzoate synthetase/4-amino-4-deoxychorismate lyase
MHWIRELEPQARGVYCGAAGVVLPGGDARFNVPIRTVTVRQGSATCGIGSGITADATPDGEWAEWAGKTQFLEQASRPFRLLQTLRVRHGEACALELHLDRLAAAAAHFGFVFHRDRIRAAVEAAVLGSGASARARVALDFRGMARIDLSAIPHTPPGPLPVALAAQAISAPTAFIRHKTTRRDHYAMFAADTPAAFDTLLWNEHGEVTEFTRGNVLLELEGGETVTPPLESGLMDGVGRACELAAGRVREARVRIGQLAGARRIWFVNALRGRVEVRLAGSPGGPPA